MPRFVILMKPMKTNYHIMFTVLIVLASDRNKYLYTKRYFLLWPLEALYNLL